MINEHQDAETDLAVGLAMSMLNTERVYDRGNRSEKRSLFIENTCHD